MLIIFLSKISINISEKIPLSANCKICGFKRKFPREIKIKFIIEKINNPSKNPKTVPKN